LIFKQAQIDKYVKKPDMAVKCFVIYGTNEGLVAEYTTALIKTVVADVYDPFSAVYIDEVDEGAINGEYNAQSLMGGRRVIIIRDGDNNLTKIFKNLFENSVSDTLIIVSSTSLNKSSSLVKLATDRDDMAAIACYEDRGEDIYATARAMLLENGFTIGNDALQLLCSRLSSDRKTNLGELEKLVTYMGERKNIVSEDVLEIIGDSSSFNTDDVCYFTASGDVLKSQKTFEKLINEGVEPISIIRSMAYHFNKILQCKGTMEKGESLDSAVKKLTPKIIFYRESNFKKQVSIWPKDKLFGALELLYKCERDCKTTNMPVSDVASYALMQLASGAARLSR
jgi:DNA polymerase-3 subunit delta